MCIQGYSTKATQGFGLIITENHLTVTVNNIIEQAMQKCNER